MKKETVFTGAAVALVTPLKADGSLDLERYRELIEEQIAAGTDAIVACGTTGEASTMNTEEHRAILRTAIEQTAGRVPVIAGSGSNDTAYGTQTSLSAKEMGADALLWVTPYYNKTSQRGLVAHFNAMANAVKMPVILYSVPSRTGVNILPETVCELYKNPYIVGIKEASGNLSQIAQIAASCDIDLYCGNDDQTLPVLSLGGKGVISVFSNVMPKEAHEMCAKFFAGDIAGAREMQLRYLDLMNGLFMDVNPIPVKEAMNQMGKRVGPCRLPLFEMDEAHKAAMTALLTRYGLL